MEVSDVAPALQERLGSEATAGLLTLFTIARQEWTTEVTTAAVERFERRLGDEISSVRIALAQTEGALRREMSALEVGLRTEIHDLGTQLRKEMNDQGNQLRQEMKTQGDELRQEMKAQGDQLRQEIKEQGDQLRTEAQTNWGDLRSAITQQGMELRKDISELRATVASLQQSHLDSRFELVKWAFAFWVGQTLAVAGLVGVMLRMAQG